MGNRANSESRRPIDNRRLRIVGEKLRRLSGEIVMVGEVAIKSEDRRWLNKVVTLTQELEAILDQLLEDLDFNLSLQELRRELAELRPGPPIPPAHHLRVGDHVEDPPK